MLERLKQLFSPQDPDLLEETIRLRSEAQFAKQIHYLCEQLAAGKSEWRPDHKFLAAKKVNGTWVVRRTYTDSLDDATFLYVFAVCDNSEKLRVGSRCLDDAEMRGPQFDINNLPSPELSDFVHNQDFFTLEYARDVIEEMKRLNKDLKVRKS
jgi:hypothetical protein